MRKNKNQNAIAKTQQNASETPKKKKKKRLSDYLPFLGLLLAGIILATPIITDLYEQWKYNGQISTMESENNWDSAKYQEMWQQAEWYNQKITGTLPDDVDPASIWPYEEQLNTNAEGMMCWIEAPAISLKIPVYHGTTEEILIQGAGHLESSSLPVGTVPSTTILPGHTGIQTARGFDEIGSLVEGDYIILHTLGKEIYYTVTYNEIVSPEAVDKLAVSTDDAELILLTCWPYSTSWQRLLVHATKTDVPPADLTTAEKVVNYAKGRNAIMFVIFIGVVILLAVLFLILGLIKRRKKKNAGQVDEQVDAPRGWLVDFTTVDANTIPMTSPYDWSEEEQDEWLNADEEEPMSNDEWEAENAAWSEELAALDAEMAELDAPAHRKVRRAARQPERQGWVTSDQEVITLAQRALMDAQDAVMKANIALVEAQKLLLDAQSRR